VLSGPVHLRRQVLQAPPLVLRDHKKRRHSVVQLRPQHRSVVQLRPRHLSGGEVWGPHPQRPSVLEVASRRRPQPISSNQQPVALQAHLVQIPPQ
jgi:hypothetical protein